MGSLFCCCDPSRRSKPKKIVLLLIGLDNAGKTTICKALAGEPVDNPIQTIGFSSVNLKSKETNVTVYDLGGGERIRDIWTSYFSDVYGIIFVIDASDLGRIEEARKTLETVLKHNKMAGKPLLVYANKQDRPNALDEIDIVEYLRLEPLVNQQKCLTLVEVCSGVVQSGSAEKVDVRLIRGYRWLVNQVMNNYSDLNRRVAADMKEDEIRVAAQREEWKKRKSYDESHPNGSTTNSALLTSSQSNGVGTFGGAGQIRPNSAPRARRSNKIHPGGYSVDESKPVILAGPNGPILGQRSIVVRALTSPNHLNHLPPIHRRQSQPSKSVDKAWDFREVMNGTKPTDTAVEYLKQSP